MLVSACLICLCNYVDGEELRRLLCLHHFHSSCIDQWLLNHLSCPFCRSSVPIGIEQCDSDGSLGDGDSTHQEVGGFDGEGIGTSISGHTQPSFENGEIRSHEGQDVENSDGTRSAYPIVGAWREVMQEPVMRVAYNMPWQLDGAPSMMYPCSEDASSCVQLPVAPPSDSRISTVLQGEGLSHLAGGGDELRLIACQLSRDLRVHRSQPSRVRQGN